MFSEQRDTHPLTVQQKVHSEAHAVLQGHLLIPVQDLKDPTEHSAIVNPCAAETTLACPEEDRQTDGEEEGRLVSPPFTSKHLQREHVQ